MSQDLKARLRRIRDIGEREKPANQFAPAAPNIAPIDKKPGENSSWTGWTEAGYKTLKRELIKDIPFSLPHVFPKSLAILIPDIARVGRLPSPGEFIFFDLETTGLSGGAGTVAFLAAFGRFVPAVDNNGNASRASAMPGKARLAVTQYLLLDYPGEGDFIGEVVKEFAPLPGDASTGNSLPVMVSYNGKCFDSQILKTRCLMNGVMIPEYHHIDLLHPSRRLWKHTLPDCSQSTIEVSILGLDRAGDVPGALAPDIWFSFLRSGDNRELLSICDHNVRDILGMASLFLALGDIAAEPLKSGSRYRFDEEALALFWKRALEKDDESYQRYKKTGERLLEAAARRGFPRAAYALALDYFKKGRGQEARLLLRNIACDVKETIPGSLRAAAYKSLAIDAEWRLGDVPAALEFTGSALEINGLGSSLRSELEKRRGRLEEKNSDAAAR